jgi:hypothetical protein
MTVRSPFVLLSTLVTCALFATDALANCSSFAAKAGTALASPQGLSAASSTANAPAPGVAQEIKELGGETAITGLWQIAITLKGTDTVIDRGFETFTIDGNELVVDTAPPVSGNVCNGTWVSLGRRAYRIKHPSWTFDDAGVTVVGTAVIRTDLVLGRNGNEFTGRVTVFFYDLGGKLLGQTAEADLKGSRITVD